MPWTAVGCTNIYQKFQDFFCLNIISSSFFLSPEIIFTELSIMFYGEDEENSIDFE